MEFLPYSSPDPGLIRISAPNPPNISKLSPYALTHEAPLDFLWVPIEVVTALRGRYGVTDCVATRIHVSKQVAKNDQIKYYYIHCYCNFHIYGYVS